MYSYASGLKKLRGLETAQRGLTQYFHFDSRRIFAVITKQHRKVIVVHLVRSNIDLLPSQRSSSAQGEFVSSFHVILSFPPHANFFVELDGLTRKMPATVEVTTISDSQHPSPILQGYWQSFLKITKRDQTRLEKEDDDTTSTTSEGVFSSPLSDTASVASKTESVCSQELHAPIPERLVDFFCVIGADLQIQKDVSDKTSHASELQFQPKLVDCVPKKRDDIEFPAELPMFCFPGGCKLSMEQKEPKVYSFVLTAGTGHRLYLSAATLSEPYTAEELCELFWDAGCALPIWLSTLSEKASSLYLPKTIAVVSHHPFYAVHTKFLDELIKIQNSESPLPLERYIANFVYDIPLASPGGGVVRWDCFGRTENCIEMARSASNKLPLVNFSYEPLFRTLSVTNILVLWGILLDEGRVVLRSKHLSLLTPIVEALLSLLFPLTWQGMYIPLLPSNMMDALDAPVPFLVGVNGKCPQPAGVVVCDLDDDVVHLGWDDNRQERTMPVLPRQPVLQLKSELSDVADPLYLIPACGLKGRITTGDGTLLWNSMREIYGHMSVLKEGSNEDLRHLILSQAGMVQIKERASKDISTGKTKGQGSLRNSSDQSTSPRRQERVVGLSYAGMKRQRQSVAASFYDINAALEQTARSSFVDFFASLLKDYKTYNKGTFHRDDFLGTFTGNSKLCVKTIINSQMFERFLNESSTRRKLFDNFIILFLNESLRRTEGEKRQYESTHMKEIIIPTAPCQVGLHKNGKFTYKTFPKLDEDELVANSNLDPSLYVVQSCCCESFLSKK